MLCSSCENSEGMKFEWWEGFHGEMFVVQDSERLCTTELAMIVHLVIAPAFLTLSQNPHHFLAPVFAYVPLPSAFTSYISPPQYPQSTPSPSVPNEAYSSSSR